MKITIVTGFFLPIPPVRGGATEKIWHQLAQQFAAAGHEVTFISRRWPGFPDRETIAGVRHVRLRGASHTRHLPLNLLLDFFWSVRVTRALPPGDVVICNTVALPTWLRRLKPSAGRVVAVIARMPKGQARFYGHVDLLLSLSAAVTAKLIAENPKLAPRIARFPFPIDWQRHASAACRLAAPAPLTIGYIGRLNPEKGINLLLAAASRLAARTDLPPWRLALTGPSDIAAGGGGEPWLAALREKFSVLLGDKLVIQGPEFDPDALARRYGALDIFCYPSLAEAGETFGVAVAEAMAAGCAPVVSGLACFNELVTHEQTGLVFDHTAPTAEADLAAALARLLTDAALRSKIAAHAQAHARQFDYAESAKNVLGELERLLR